MEVISIAVDRLKEVTLYVPKAFMYVHIHTYVISVHTHINEDFFFFQCNSDDHAGISFSCTIPHELQYERT